MEDIDVGCAIIVKEKKILIAQRKPEDSFGEYWEFPGGKVEFGESIEDCLIREAEEELGISIRPERLLEKGFHRYPEKTLHLYFYLCRWVKGDAKKIDCHDFAWVAPEELKNYQFPPADDGIIEELIRNQQDYFKI